jgi:hypothetical protein
MIRKSRALATAGVAMSLIALAAAAEAQAHAASTVPAVRTLVVSGDWIAKERQAPTIDGRDVCIAFTAAANSGFGLRASTADIEVRYSQGNWVLPPDVAGSLVIDVGRYHTVLTLTGNTSDTAIAAVSRDQLHDMIAAMEKASWMTVTAGVAPPRRVSLRGSNRATTAFMSCISGIGASGQDDWIDPLP